MFSLGLVVFEDQIGPNYFLPGNTNIRCHCEKLFYFINISEGSEIV